MSENDPQECTITIYQGEDFAEAFCIMAGTRPMDLTDKTVELIIRPSFDHPTLIRAISSAGASPEITIDDAENGGCIIFISKDVVASDLPVSDTMPWAQFLRVLDDTYGTYDMIWRGPFYVKPGRDEA